MPNPPDPTILPQAHPSLAHFNPSAELPYGLQTAHIHAAMIEFLAFLSGVDRQLLSSGLPRLEDILMPANFSSIVGEFMKLGIPKHCATLVANQYPNGHPDLIPADRFLKDAVQHVNDGIEIKASRNPSGWQGHNPEDIWLMVFVFDTNSPPDKLAGKALVPFQFREVLGARLSKSDWSFSGRSATSRRTITASVIKSGYAKMAANWIYRNPALIP